MININRRKLLYWGLPIIGALIGAGHCIYRLRKHDDSFNVVNDIANEAIDAFGGAVIWFGIVSIGSAVLKILSKLNTG